MMRHAALLALALLLAAVAVACDRGADASGTPVNASLLVEASPDDPRWFRDIEVPEGTDGYELLEIAVDGELESEFYAEFRSHFVESILGVAAEQPQFWAVFVWNEGNAGWEPLPVGADLFSVKEDHVMAWALVEYDPDTPQLPVATP